jgi:hypothetical protein
MEDSPFFCPYCEIELHLPDDVWYYTCDSCGTRLDLKSQFAFLRGLDAFREGQDIMEKVSPRKRRTSFNSLDQSAMELFKQAYSSLQVAFQANLEEGQRSLGVEMMNSMAQEFMKRSMISPLELTYWNTLMVEQTSRNEFDSLSEKLSQPGGKLTFLARWRWKMRQKQLRDALFQIDNKLKLLEKQIEFIDIPKARNKNWKPRES